MDATKYGLLYVPNLEGLNDEDFIGDIMNCSIEACAANPTGFSEDNVRVMKATISKLGNKCKAILEIGVNPVDRLSSTYAILSQKPKGCIYFGVDKQGWKFSFIDAKRKIYGLGIDSSDYDTIVECMENVGIKQLDIIHIDGYHSVNQVLREWRFTELLSPHGCVVMHDTTLHPGPAELLKALDPNVWELEQYHKGSTVDWGIAVIWKK